MKTLFNSVTPQLQSHLFDSFSERSWKEWSSCLPSMTSFSIQILLQIQMQLNLYHHHSSTVALRWTNNLLNKSGGSVLDPPVAFGNDGHSLTLNSLVCSWPPHSLALSFLRAPSSCPKPWASARLSPQIPGCSFPLLHLSSETSSPHRFGHHTWEGDSPWGGPALTYFSGPTY